MREFGWRGGLLISSGLIFNICVIGIILRDREKKPITSEDTANIQDTEKYISSQNEINQNIVFPLHERNKKLLLSKIEFSSNHSITSCKSLPEKGYDFLREKRLSLADRFHGSSLSSIPELYRSAILYKEATQDTLQKDHDNYANVCRITKEVFNNVNFLLLATNVTLFCFGFSVLYAHIAAYGISIGFSIPNVNSVFLALGVSNIVGRVLLGFIGKRYISFLHSKTYTVCTGVMYSKEPLHGRSKKSLLPTLKSSSLPAPSVIFVCSPV